MATLSAPQAEELAYEDSTPTPVGWKRKLIPYLGKGLGPTRIAVVFVAPSGDEFKSKPQLQQYLKKTKASASMSEFIWSTDDSPRRSSRSASNSTKLPPTTIGRKKQPTKAFLEESKACNSSPNQKLFVYGEPLNEGQMGQKKRSNQVAQMEGEEDIRSEIVQVESSRDIDGSLSAASMMTTYENKRNQLKVTNAKRNVKTAVKSSRKEHSMAKDNDTVLNDIDQQIEITNEEKLRKTIEDSENDKASDHLDLPSAKDEMTQDATEMSVLMDTMENDNMAGMATGLLGSDISGEATEADFDFVDEKWRQVCEEDVDKLVDQGEHAEILEGS